MRPEEKVFEVYPPKTKIDIYGECHDEDEELRKAYIKGCHDTVAEIMCDTIKRTELPTSLEEAAEEYNESMSWAWEAPNHPHKSAFIAGAEWQKEYMMKDAVEADVNTYKNLEEGTSWAEFVVEMPTNKLGDKVRIIIVKED